MDPKTYKIGPGDVLSIIVWREPQLSRTVGVRPDGMITMMLIGEIQVNGLTPLQLGERLTEKYAEYVNGPIITVTIQEVLSKFYYLAGNLNRRGKVALVVPTRVSEAIVMAGGFAEFANKKKVVILRGDKRYYFNYNDWMNGKNLDQNIYLETGDYIIVN